MSDYDVLAGMRPPEYGSPAWHALPVDHPQRAEAEHLAAECWRLLASSPHVAELLSEWQQWIERELDSESSTAISAAVDWRQVAQAPTYAELERRRSTYTTPARTPAQIRAAARRSWAAYGREAA